jgi:hypothetical protein
VGSEVYANGREVSSKAGANKVIAAFPDVCLSPPSPPAGPIPIPYPVSSDSGDTADGSTSVKIGGKEVMLKDKSHYKKCMGDEAATKSLGQGAINHALSGKVYFVSWSMDVEVEGENVVRHLDMTTSNHASPMPNEALTIPGIENLSADVQRDCEATFVKYKLHAHENSPCNYSSTGDQSHHIAQNACFESARGTPIPSCKGKYSDQKAPAICLETKGDSDTPHKEVNRGQREWAKSLDKPPKLSEVRANGHKNLVDKGGLTKEEADCLVLVVDEYMKKVGITESTPLRTPTYS